MKNSIKEDSFEKISPEILPAGIAENAMTDQVIQLIQQSLHLPQWAGTVMNISEMMLHLFK